VQSIQTALPKDAELVSVEGADALRRDVRVDAVREHYAYAVDGRSSLV